MSHDQIINFRKLGLHGNQIAESRNNNGSNALTPPKREGFWLKLWGNFRDDKIVQILVVALVIDVVIAIFGYTEWYEGLAITAAVVLATGVAALTESRSEGAFAILQEEASHIKTKVFRDGELKEIPIDEVVVGDYILLQQGDKITADGILVHGSLKVLQSAITGESDFIPKTKTNENYQPESGNPDDPHLLLRGTIVGDDEGVMKVITVGDNTALGKIAKELGDIEERKSPLQVKLSNLGDGISKFGYIGAGFIFVAFMFKNAVMDNGYSWSLILDYITNPSLIGPDVLHAFILAVIIIVVAVPEGLPMMIHMVLSMNVHKLVKNNVLVRENLGIETSGSLNHLFVDKTGTITFGQLMATGFLTGTGQNFDKYEDIPKNLRSKLLFSLVNNTASVINPADPEKNKEAEIVGGNPTERAMLQFTSSALTATNIGKIQTTNELPFNSKRKFSATQVDGKNSLTLIKGAPEAIFSNCGWYYNNSGAKTKLTDRTVLENKFNQLSEEQYRVVAIACSESPIKGSTLPEDMTLLGIISIRDEIRPESKPSIEAAINAGIKVTMITGDRHETAVAIAREVGLVLGIQDEVILTSSEFNEMTDDEIKEILPNLKLISRALPNDKSKLIRISQSRNEVNGMTGDGVNDAPALQAADVGYSMGKNGTEVAKEASSIVILDDNLNSIAKAVLYGRTIFNSIRKFIIFQLTVNVAAILLAFLGPFFGYDFPLTMVQLLWINLIMDTLAALAFGGEPALQRYMLEKPKRRDENIISGDMWSSILINGITITILSILFLKLGFVREIFSSEEAFLAGFFGFFVFLHNWNKFNARTEQLNLFEHILENKRFLFIVGLIFTVQIIFTYAGGEILRTTALSATEMFFILSTSFVIIPIDLTRKWIRDRLNPATTTNVNLATNQTATA
jgi:P-type Ca2+ transporter type 2C